MGPIMSLDAKCTLFLFSLFKFYFIFYNLVASTLFPMQRFLEITCFVDSEVSNDGKGDGELFIRDNGLDTT